MKFILTLLTIFFFQSLVHAQSSETNLQNGKAIGGYDPVAYFTQGKPLKGKEEYKSKIQDSEWLFASLENKKLFDANPNKYLPQYGGYCAFGVAQGYKAKIDPTAWSIVNGKLYLNYNASVQKDWLKDQTQMILNADKNWTTVKKK